MEVTYDFTKRGALGHGRYPVMLDDTPSCTGEPVKVTLP